MKIVTRTLFVASLLANAVAVYALVTEPVAPADRSDGRTQNKIPPDSAVSRDVASVNTYFQELRDRGLAIDETKPLVLAWLGNRSAHGDGEDKYWDADYTSTSIERLRDRVALDDNIRAELLQIYGPDARHDQAFRLVFEPLDRRYGFLNSEQQLAVQKYQLERQLAVTKETPVRPTNPGRQTPVQVSTSSSQSASVLNELTDRLGAAAAVQYLYRFLPLAEQLRAANLGLSELEFRDVFDALLNLESTSDAESYRTTRESLRSVLGNERFTRLWATRDPVFSMVEEVGHRKSLSDDLIFSAYEIFNDTQDRFADVASRYVEVDPERASGELRSVQEEMEQRLIGLVGEDEARAFLSANSQFAFAIRQEPSAD